VASGTNRAALRRKRLISLLKVGRSAAQALRSSATVASLGRGIRRDESEEPERSNPDCFQGPLGCAGRLVARVRQIPVWGIVAGRAKAEAVGVSIPEKGDPMRSLNARIFHAAVVAALLLASGVGASAGGWKWN
jgi:hypothetical protein